MAGRGQLRLKIWAGDLGGGGVTGGQGRREGRKKLLCVDMGVRGGQRMKRPEMGRVIEWLGMTREIEGPASEEGLRSICR